MKIFHSCVAKLGNINLQPQFSSNNSTVDVVVVV